MAEETRGPAGPAAAPASGGPPAGTGTGNGNGTGRRKGRGGLVILLLVLIVAGLGGGYWYFKLRGVVSTDDAYVDGDRATITTKVLGRIDTLGTDEGDTVQAGQLLIQLDTADLKARLDQADAQLDLARKNVKLAEVTQSRAQDDANRAAVQIKGHAITQEAYDHSRSALEAAQAEHAIALAKVQTARSAVNVILQQIADTRVVAPFTGVVAKRWLLPGDVVQPGQPVFTVYDLQHVYVTAVFEETKLRYLPLGTEVDMSVDAYPNLALTGKVILIGAAAASQFSLIPPANASGNFTKVTQRVPVRIAIDKSSEGADPPRLLPGMSVVVTVRNPHE
ncbi:MAG: HlyD family secretion protein [Gemmatimonadetes bacterium]|nr:HlyD family secretion protein [Gemmatimonadota bacterium]